MIFTVKNSSRPYYDEAGFVFIYVFEYITDDNEARIYDPRISLIIEEKSGFPFMMQNIESDGLDIKPTDHSLPRSEIVVILVNR